ncbi:VOC family protein [Actinoplanes oblitus]|uniref:VOC family protein n=1 Tax=Actinoplanes oblitus TaxID=3040509 RepID=A0ABY8WLR9_9ACTN|nr:VOC family protein [Actinoplanes oblitus]WIM97966.1 VOC family protein [Actinoplanes oblitus]
MNNIGWIEVGTERPEEAERFYGEVFGWTFADDDTSLGLDGRPYRMVTGPDGGAPFGGFYGTGGKAPDQAIFLIVVADTEAACRQAEAHGAKVLVGPRREENGLVYARLSDPLGNLFGVFTPPAR